MLQAEDQISEIIQQNWSEKLHFKNWLWWNSERIKETYKELNLLFIDLMNREVSNL